MNRGNLHPLSKTTPGTWRLHDGERPLFQVDSPEELERLVQELPETGSTPNRIVELESPQGERLSIGVAGPKDGDNPGLLQPFICLQLTNANLDRPYLIPISDSSLNLENGGVIVFRYEGTWTEILKRNCVPMDVAIRIAQHYYRTGILPQWIGWEEV
jgi:hypothetical protein